MAIINRHNYEEFFLLYIDNELDEAKRTIVEIFVKQNPDLAKELEMLKQSALTADDAIKFKAKDILFRKEAGISLSNYEEYFLLYIDNELSKQEDEDVQKFVLKHPHLRNELTLLQQTKLEPGAIDFTDKSTLYRKEEKERRVIPNIWMRMSAAAIIIIIGGIWMLNLKPGIIERSEVVAIHKDAKPSVQSIDLSKSAKALAEQPIRLHKKGKKTTSAEIVKNKGSLKVDVERNTLDKEAGRNVKQSQETIVTEKDLALIEPSKPVEEELLSPGEVSGKNSTSNSGSDRMNNETSSAALASTQHSAADKSFAKEAVYLETGNSDEDKTIYIGGAEINKNKLKGLLKKAVDFLEKKAGKNSDEKTIQITGYKFKS